MAEELEDRSMDVLPSGSEEIQSPVMLDEVEDGEEDAVELADDALIM